MCQSNKGNDMIIKVVVAVLVPAILIAAFKLVKKSAKINSENAEKTQQANLELQRGQIELLKAQQETANAQRQLEKARQQQNLS